MRHVARHKSPPRQRHPSGISQSSESHHSPIFYTSPQHLSSCQSLATPPTPGPEASRPTSVMGRPLVHVHPRTWNDVSGKDRRDRAGPAQGIRWARATICGPLSWGRTVIGSHESWLLQEGQPFPHRLQPAGSRIPQSVGKREDRWGTSDLHPTGSIAMNSAAWWSVGGR